mgnify:CR=1 FL=1
MSSQQEPTGRPGRYQRSAAGLVSSLVVTVVVIGGLGSITGVAVGALLLSEIDNALIVAAVILFSAGVESALLLPLVALMVLAEKLQL